MKRSSALLSVAVLFLSGVAIGTLGHQLLSDRSAGIPGGPPEPLGPPGGPFLERMLDQIDATPEQREKIAQIHAESRKASHAIREEIRPVIDGLMRETREQIGEVLTAEQMARMDELMERHHRRAERFFLGEGGRGEGGPRRRGGRQGARPGRNP